MPVRTREPKVPECEKLSTHRDEFMRLSAFLEQCEENGYHMCKEQDGEYWPAGDRQKLLYEYFKIDENKLEKERKSLLSYQRKMNDSNPR